MKTLFALAVVLLAGCMGMPEVNLKEGETGCQTVTMAYGSISTVRSRADNAEKGQTQKGKTRITCGSAVMEIDSTIGAAPK